MLTVQNRGLVLLPRLLLLLILLSWLQWLLLVLLLLLLLLLLLTLLQWCYVTLSPGVLMWWSYQFWKYMVKTCAAIEMSVLSSRSVGWAVTHISISSAAQVTIACKCTIKLVRNTGAPTHWCPIVHLTVRTCEIGGSVCEQLIDFGNTFSLFTSKKTKL